jgi:hypothetical protein
VHLFWAFGGSVGLEESAGAELARDRPTWFVLLGLFGVALLLAASAVLGLRMARQQPGLLLPVVGAGVAGVLLLRAIGIEVLLLADADYGKGAISAGERFWTLVLWNPWFLAGGVAFGLAAVAAGRPAARPTS